MIPHVHEHWYSWIPASFNNLLAASEVVFLRVICSDASEDRPLRHRLTAQESSIANHYSDSVVVVCPPPSTGAQLPM